MKRHWIYLMMLAIFTIVFIWSAIKPNGWGIWFFEVSPAIGLVLLLLLTYRRFPLSPLAYTIIFMGTLVMLIGGHYSYAEVPLFHGVQEALHFKRNHFDRFGHLFQGMITAALAYEYFYRRHIIQKTTWLPTVIIGMSLAFSAAFELFEFIAGILFATDLANFLGLQGDIWDAHWDMFWACVGAILVIIMSPWQRKQIKRLRRIHQKITGIKHQPKTS